MSPYQREYAIRQILDQTVFFEDYLKTIGMSTGDWKAIAEAVNVQQDLVLGEVSASSRAQNIVLEVRDNFFTYVQKHLEKTKTNANANRQALLLTSADLPDFQKYGSVTTISGGFILNEQNQKVCNQNS